MKRMECAVSEVTVDDVLGRMLPVLYIRVLIVTLMIYGLRGARGRRQ